MSEKLPASLFKEKVVANIRAHGCWIVSREDIDTKSAIEADELVRDGLAVRAKELVS